LSVGDPSSEGNVVDPAFVVCRIEGFQRANANALGRGKYETCSISVEIDGVDFGGLCGVFGREVIPRGGRVAVTSFVAGFDGIAERLFLVWSGGGEVVGVAVRILVCKSSDVALLDVRLRLVIGVCCVGVRQKSSRT
jgi:hypothetical protein